MEGPARQDGHLHRRRARAASTSTIPRLHADVPELGVPRRTPARRAARHRAAGDRRRARAARPAEHDAHARARRRRATSARCSCSSRSRRRTPGELYGVNAFDQPGVELGKQFTYAMLGRADAEQARAGMGPAAETGPEAHRLSVGVTRRAGLRPPPAPDELHQYHTSNSVVSLPPSGRLHLCEDCHVRSGHDQRAVRRRGHRRRRPRHRRAALTRSPARRWISSCARPSSPTAWSASTRAG